MIWTVMRVSAMRLLHHPIEWLLTFGVPIVFFSIFALIFGDGVGSGTVPPIKVVVADEMGTETSDVLVEQLRQCGELRWMNDVDANELTRQQATRRVVMGNATLAIVICRRDGVAGIDLLSDPSDPIAARVVSGIVSQSLAQSRLPIGGLTQNRALAIQRGVGRGDNHQSHSAASFEGQLTDSTTSPSRRSGVATGSGSASEVVLAGFERTRNQPSFQRSTRSSEGTTLIEANADGAAAPWAAGTSEVGTGDRGIRLVDVMSDGKSNPVVSMYAAGIAVMFLLFSATGGGGVLLEEREQRTLDRLLTTRMSVDQWLLGKWFFLSFVGMAQIAVMFVWAQLVFGVSITDRLDGIVMMTVATTMAASAFGLLLASLCNSRAQLNGLSVVLILTMSALGGSMVPRYVMSESMRQYGRWTFNAWALDGFEKVLWREVPVLQLAPQLSILLASAVVMLLMARLLAVRWQGR